MMPLLIDLDGTILDVTARHHAIYSAILVELGHEPLTREDFWRCRRDGNSTQALLAGTMTEDERASFSERWLERVESPAALALDVPFDGAADALERLRQDFDLVLVTLRRERANLLRQLQQLGIEHFFRQVIAVDGGRERRKDVLPGLERVRAGGYVIGDAEADIEFAADTERSLICVANGVRKREFLAARGATTIVNSIVEVPDRLATATRAA